MMEMTQAMVDRVKEAVAAIDPEVGYAEIPNMGGHYVVIEGREMPPGARRMHRIGLSGDAQEYIICAVANGN